MFLVMEKYIREKANREIDLGKRLVWVSGAIRDLGVEGLCLSLVLLIISGVILGKWFRFFRFLFFFVCIVKG